MSNSSDEILVSISCITYNHAKYIRQTLDGFLKQKCNFVFEVLIHDDASTDGTSEIIKEYVDKYPFIFQAIIQNENQYSQGIRGMSKRFNFPRAKGKYIAMCEGDDYWIYENKLQEQVNFLEQNTDYNLCFHNALVYNEEDKSSREFNKLEIGVVSGNQVLANWIVPTASAVFRRDSIACLITIDATEILFGDILMFLAIMESGKAYYISNECWSFYRRHEAGVSFITNHNETFYLRFIKHHKKLNSIFNYKYNKESKKLQGEAYFSLMVNSFKKYKWISFLKYSYISFLNYPKSSFRILLNKLL